MILPIVEAVVYVILMDVVAEEEEGDVIVEVEEISLLDGENIVDDTISIGTVVAASFSVPFVNVVVVEAICSDSVENAVAVVPGRVIVTALVVVGTPGSMTPGRIGPGGEADGGGSTGGNSGRMDISPGRIGGNDPGSNGGSFGSGGSTTAARVGTRTIAGAIIAMRRYRKKLRCLRNMIFESMRDFMIPISACDVSFRS